MRRNGDMVSPFCDPYVSRRRPVRTFVVDDVVGLKPARRADAELGLRAAGEVLGGFDVALDERPFGARQLRIRDLALLLIRHGELAVADRGERLLLQPGAKILDRLVDRAGGQLGAAEHDADQAGTRRQRHRLAERSDGLLGLSRFEQRLALQLMEIRVVRHARDQRVDGPDGGARAAGAVGDDRARILRRQALVGARIAPCHRARAFDEGCELGAHHVVAKLQRGRIGRVPIRTLLRRRLQLLEAVARHRMRLCA